MPRRGPQKPPPEGYVCRACNEPGHWVQDCTKRTKKRKAKNDAPAAAARSKKEGSDEEEDEPTFKIKKPAAGTAVASYGRSAGTFKLPPSAASPVSPIDKYKPSPDPSKQRNPTKEDIAKAKEMMPIINPSKAPKCLCGEKARCKKMKKKGSPAFGQMFWWCPKAKGDDTRCKFVQKADVI